jgi:hypothetical protein
VTDEHVMCERHPGERADWAGGAGCIMCELGRKYARAADEFERRTAELIGPDGVDEGKRS